MCENLSCPIQALHEAAKEVKTRFPNILVEASGGITEDNLKQYMGPSIDILSLSRTTQGYDIVDFSFKIKKDGRDPSNPVVKRIKVNTEENGNRY